MTSQDKHTLDEIAQDLRSRLISIFLVDADGRRPCFGGVEKLQTDLAWKDSLVFNEYFHGDNGAGLRIPPNWLDRCRRLRYPAPARRRSFPR